MSKGYYDNYKKLTKDNRQILNNMMQYIDARSLNEYVVKDVRNDIAGMLLENQERNADATELFDGDYKKFCDDVVANSPRKTVMEIIFDIVAFMTCVLAIVLPVWYLLEVIFVSGRVDGVYINTPWDKLIEKMTYGFLGGFAALFVQRNALSKKWKVFPILIVSFIVIAIILLLLLKAVPVGNVTVNVLAGTLIFASAFVLFTLLRKFFAKRNLIDYKE